MFLFVIESRALKAGSVKPLLVRPVDETFPQAGRCAALGALQAAYVVSLLLEVDIKVSSVYKQERSYCIKMLLVSMLRIAS